MNRTCGVVHILEASIVEENKGKSESRLSRCLKMSYSVRVS